MNATPGLGEHLLPWWSTKSVSVWHFGFDQHLLTTNSLSLSMTAHVGCGTSNQEREAMVCRIPIDIFFPLGMSAEEITAQWKLAAQISLVVNESYLPPSQDSEQSPLDSRLTVGTTPVQSWAERVCWGQRKQLEMIDSVIHCEAKKNAWWRVLCPKWRIHG